MTPLPGVVLLLALTSQAPPTTPQELLDRAEADFVAGRVAESVAGFDRLAALVPSAAPGLWQRGIGLYYLGRFDECAAQFASFYKEDPTDLENASWHFLCVARAKSVADARAAILQAGPDPRVLRREIYLVLSGKLTAAELLDMATRSVPLVEFYARLYLGLFAEAQGDTLGALEHITQAAGDRFRGLGGFMNAVARVHLRKLQASAREP
jgi:lipoprotein NlpI